jgi:hypothetical protein
MSRSPSFSVWALPSDRGISPRRPSDPVSSPEPRSRRAAPAIGRPGESRRSPTRWRFPGGSGPESRQDCLVTRETFGKLVVVQQIALPDGDAIMERLEPFGRTNKGGHRMASFYCLPNDFQSRSACRAQYDQFHRAVLIGWSRGAFVGRKNRRSAGLVKYDVTNAAKVSSGSRARSPSPESR